MIISTPRASSAATSCPNLPGSFGTTNWVFNITAGTCLQDVARATEGFRVTTLNSGVLFIDMQTDGEPNAGFTTTNLTIYGNHNITAVGITPNAIGTNNIESSTLGVVGVYKVRFSTTVVGEKTYVMTITKGGVSYTITVTGTFVRNLTHDVTSITITGGAFGAAGMTADDAQAVTSAFADAGVRTHNWSTQTQIFDRFFGPSSGGDGGTSFAPNVARPSGLNFHSAEIRNDVEARRLQMLAESYAEIRNSYYYGDNNQDETTRLDEWLRTNLKLASQSADGTGFYDAWASGGYAAMELYTPGAAYKGHLFYGRVGADYKLNDNTLLGLGLGYERGQADVVLDNTDYNSQAFSVSGYWGVKLSDTLLFDGSVGYAFVDYDFEGDSNNGNFDAGRLFATANLTGIYELPDMLQLRPKLGLLYSDEHQQAYADDGGTDNPARTLELGRLAFGGELHFTGYDRVRPYITIQGEWDFIRPDTVTLSNGSDYRADELGASAGAGMTVDLMPNLQGSVEVSFDSIGREDFNAWSTRGKILYLF